MDEPGAAILRNRVGALQRIAENSFLNILACLYELLNFTNDETNISVRDIAAWYLKLLSWGKGIPLALSACQTLEHCHLLTISPKGGVSFLHARILDGLFA